jgi:DNA replication protein
MMEFKGFPAKMQFTPVPNIVFSSLLPQISDIVELKVLLHIFKVLYPKKGYLRYTSRGELSSDAVLNNDLKGDTEEGLQKALESLVRKEVLLQVQLARNETGEDIYFLNTEANRLTVSRIESGEIVLEGFKPGKPVPVRVDEPSDIFTLYEENIGMLTPLIADELKEALRNYPDAWIKDAIKEAVALNKRNWRYIVRILENWSSEGKDNGTHRGNLKKNTDPDKYIRGRYGHMVQR